MVAEGRALGRMRRLDIQYRVELPSKRLFAWDNTSVSEAGHTALTTEVFWAHPTHTVRSFIIHGRESVSVQV